MKRDVLRDALAELAPAFAAAMPAVRALREALDACFLDLGAAAMRAGATFGLNRAMLTTPQGPLPARVQRFVDRFDRGRWRGARKRAKALRRLGRAKREAIG